MKVQHTRALATLVLAALSTTAAGAQAPQAADPAAVLPGIGARNAQPIHAELVAVHRVLPLGSPIDFELVAHSSAPWSGVFRGIVWEVRDEATGEWRHARILAGDEPSELRLTQASRAHAFRIWASASAILQLFPGRWRACGVFTDLGRETRTPWCEIELTEHEGNRRIMSGELGDRLQLAWQIAVSNSEVGEQPPATPGGMTAAVPVGTLDRLAQALDQLREHGASTELAVRGEAVVVRREMQRATAMVDPATRVRSLRGLRTRLDRLIQECEPMSTPLGGQRGALLELDAQMLKSFDSLRARQLHDEVQLDRPLLAERLR